MVKKSLISIFFFCLIALASTPIFASNIANDAGNTLSNIRDGVQNMANGAEGAMEHAKNGAMNMANDAGNALGRAKDGVSNMMHNGEQDVKRAESDVAGTSNNGYTATRTSTTNTLSSNRAVAWTILAAIALTLIGVVWYYGLQTQNRVH